MLNSSNRESRLTTSEKLLTTALRHKIKVDRFPMPIVREVAMEYAGKSFVNVDPSVSSRDLVYYLAHGIGHIICGELSNPYSQYDNTGKHERRADEWAIQKVFSKSKIKKAIRTGCIEPWQIAEEFGTSVEFATKALIYYKGTN